MQKSLQTGHVPGKRIIQEIDRVLGTSWPWSFESGMTSGFEPSRLEPLTRYWTGDDLTRMISREWIDFDFADRILCALGLVESWRGELADIYDEVNLATAPSVRVKKVPKGYQRCKRVGCTEIFKINTGRGRRRIYCSRRCGVTDWARRKDTDRVTTEKRKYDTCPNGHDRSPENVKILTDSRSGKPMVRCRACYNERRRKRYAQEKLDQSFMEKKRARERELYRKRRAAA